MNEILTSELLVKLLKKKEKSLLFYSLLAACWLIISIIILIFSTKEYIINLIINIVTTIVFGFYSVYYFTITLKAKNDEIKLVRMVDNGIVVKEYAMFDSYISEEKYENITVYTYMFKTLDNKERKLHSFYKIEESSNRYYIESKLNYIVSFKVNNNE